MNQEKLKEMVKMMHAYITDIVLLESLFELFSSDEEVNEMIDFMNTHDELTKYDINTEAYSITMRKHGIDIPAYEECRRIKEAAQ